MSAPFLVPQQSHLQDDDILHAHDLNSCQVLRCLGLRACLVGCNQQQRAVHDSSTVEHGGHENIMAGAVYEGDVADELQRGARVLADRVVLLGAAVCAVALGPGAHGALVDLGVGITQLDCDVTFQLVLEAHRLHA